MPSYGEEIQKNFGVRLRGPSDREHTGYGGPPQFGGPFVERLVYLPPDPRERPGPGPPGNWVLGPGGHQLGPSQGPPGPTARLELLRGPAWGARGQGVRRATSFNTGAGLTQCLAEVKLLYYCILLSLHS